MMLLRFSILYIFAVFKICSAMETRHGRVEPIGCQRWHGDSYAYKIDSQWQPNYIYPVRLCATVKGERPQRCAETSNSNFQLFLGIKAIHQAFPIYGPLELEDFRASDVHCHVFSATNIAAALKHVDFNPNNDFNPTYLDASAVLYGAQTSNAAATLQLSVDVNPYYLSAPGEFGAYPGTFHAIVCDFPECKIRIRGPHRLRSVEYFRKESGKFPQSENVGGSVTDETFSVTTIECDAGQCPTWWSAADCAETSCPLSFSAEYQLQIGIPGGWS